MSDSGFLAPMVYAIFLWWFSTGVIVALYGRSQAVIRACFVLFSILLLGALVGIYQTRDLSHPLDVYIAITCGMSIWGWQTASYYLGFITGPGEPDNLPKQAVEWEHNIVKRAQMALRFTLYHELAVIAVGVILVALTWAAPNRWGLYIYITLWLMHFSAKANVFLGVRNFDVEFLPEQLHYLDHLLIKRDSNPLFPFSIVIATSIALLLLYQGLEPRTPPHQTIGFIFVGTMMMLGIFEHWMMILPLRSILVGFGLQPIPVTGITTLAAPQPLQIRAYIPTTTEPTNADIPMTRRIRRTYTFERGVSPLVVDFWQARQPIGKTPILLIHGWGGSGSYWRDTAFKLSQTTSVIVPDLPGTGRSQPVNQSQNMFDQVETLGWILDEMELDQVQVVGHSMGGAMGLLLAQQRPQQVERLILTSLSFFLTKRQEQIYRTVMSAYRVSLGFRPGWLANAPFMTQIMGSRYFYRLPDNEEILREGLREYLNLDAGTAIACALNATDERIPQAGAAVRVPALLIACRQDEVMPLDNVEYTINTIPGCQVRWIDRCGHLPMVERPAEYMAILNDFLDVSE